MTTSYLESVTLRKTNREPRLFMTRVGELDADRVIVLAEAETSYLDDLLLDPDSHIKAIPSSDLSEIPEEHLMLWCLRNAIYQIPTHELIQWLSSLIAGRQAIEIGSGKSGIGKALGIRSTDSYMQTMPEVRAYYELMGQPIVNPPDYVEKIDAESAFHKYNPQVVIGSFITHRWREGYSQGNAYGPNEESFLGAEYIHIGNKVTHRAKPILNVPHEEYHFPWLRSRAINQLQNVIWVWKQQNED